MRCLADAVPARKESKIAAPRIDHILIIGVAPCGRRGSGPGRTLLPGSAAHSVNLPADPKLGNICGNGTLSILLVRLAVLLPKRRSKRASFCRELRRKIHITDRSGGWWLCAQALVAV